MVTDIKKLRKFNDLLSKHSQRRHIIVLNPKGEYKNLEQPDEEIEYDKDEWRIPENLSTWISELEKNLFLVQKKKFYYSIKNYVEILRRCLIVNLDGKEYIIDGDKGILRPFDAKEFDKKDAEFFRFHNPNIGKDTIEHYDGR